MVVRVLPMRWMQVHKLLTSGSAHYIVASSSCALPTVSNVSRSSGSPLKRFCGSAVSSGFRRRTPCQSAPVWQAKSCGQRLLRIPRAALSGSRMLRLCRQPVEDTRTDPLPTARSGLFTGVSIAGGAWRLRLVSSSSPDSRTAGAAHQGYPSDRNVHERGARHLRHVPVLDMKVAD